jgi:hypothetical protein
MRGCASRSNDSTKVPTIRSAAILAVQMPAHAVRQHQQQCVAAVGIGGTIWLYLRLPIC